LCLERSERNGYNNEKISKSLYKLINPVIVLDEKEVRDILTGDKNFSRDNIFVPSPWKDNISQNFFESYRKDISEKAEEIKKQRIEKENEYIITEALLKDLRKFYKENSYEDFSNMKKQFEEVKGSIPKSSNKTIGTLIDIRKTLKMN
jgi:hypothetical protein